LKGKKIKRKKGVLFMKNRKKKKKKGIEILVHGVIREVERSALKEKIDKLIQDRTFSAEVFTNFTSDELKTCSSKPHSQEYFEVRAIAELCVQSREIAELLKGAFPWVQVRGSSFDFEL
jgi:hypothetical protein